MGRPKVALIDKAAAIEKALEIIDADGIDALSIRRLGLELGVHGASLYYHFADKDAILTGVRRLVLQRLRVPEAHDVPWQDFVVDAAKAFREALVRHPNTVPLMMPHGTRRWGLTMTDFAAEVILRAGVPRKYVNALLTSTETLAFGAAVFHPDRFEPDEAERLAERHPNLGKAFKADRMSDDERFDLQLRALVAGWSIVLAQDAAPKRPAAATRQRRPAARAGARSR